LSSLLETPVEQMVQETLRNIANYTVFADKRCRGLFDVIQNDILGDTIIAPYRLSEDQAESQKKVSTSTSFSSKSVSNIKQQPPQLAPAPVLASVPPLANKHKQAEEDKAGKETKRKKLSTDPNDKNYDEELALQEAIQRSQDLYNDDDSMKDRNGDEDEEKDLQEALQKSLAESQGAIDANDDEDEDFKMALQLSLQER